MLAPAVRRADSLRGTVPVEVRLRIPGQPVGKARPRMGRGRRVYTPAKTAAYEQLVAAEWQAAGSRRLPDGPFALLAEFAFARPAAHYRTKARLLRPDAPAVPTRPDTDNLIKGVLDGAQGLAFTDDGWCCEIHATKRWCANGEGPHAAIVLRAI